MKFEGKTYKDEKNELVGGWLATRNKNAQADPETDAARFEAAKQEATAYAAKTGYDTAVFKNLYGFYFIREAKFCEPAIEKLFVAEAAKREAAR